MVEIKPFIGIHYNPNKIENLNLVLAPPYDIISNEEQEIFYENSVYNIIRIIKGKEEHGDSEEDNKYTRAAKFYKEWLEKEIFITSKKPRMYIYEQEYFLKNGERKIRKGFIATMKLETFDQGNVLPHEKTFSEPKTDRLKLLRATKANFGQIFTLYSDTHNIISEIIKNETKKPPVLEFEDWDEVKHRWWNIEDAETNIKIQNEMKNKKIYIADGHHRYETAVNYMQEMKERFPDSTGIEPWNYRIITFINTDEDTITILPTHRLMHNLHDVNFTLLEKQILEYFDLQIFLFNKDNEAEQRKKMIKAMHQNSKSHMLGMFCKGNNRFYALKLKNEDLIDKEINHEHCIAWKKLDVTILHTLIIEKILKIIKDTGKYIEYVKDDVDKVIQMMYEEDFQIAFFLNPTTLEEVKDVANAHEKMPEKSTHFYPKLISGLIIQSVE